MDSIFFSAKRVHWTAVKFGRGLLRGHPLTPARFDLLFLLTTGKDWTQRKVRKALGVARATASEMLGALEELGFVARSVVRRGQTRVVSLTKIGREVLERAYEACIASGQVTFAVELALSNGNAECDVYSMRAELEWWTTLLRRWLGDAADRVLYEWDPEEIEGSHVALGSTEILDLYPEYASVTLIDVDRIPIEELEPVTEEELRAAAACASRDAAGY